MNQILDYNPNKSSGGGSSGSDKIVRVFAVLLIIFAICLLGSGAYGLYKKNTSKTEPTAAPTKAKISVEQKDKTATINVSHDKAIEKIIYSWDNDKEVNNKGNGESTMKIEVTLLAGEHTLNIKVTDIDGVESTYEQTIISESGEDKIYPVISLKVNNETKKLVVSAKDETELDFVTYRWNDEEEKRMDVEEGEKELEFEIEILRGQNDLTIVAVDKNNNTTKETKTFSGVTKPEVEIKVAPDKSRVDVTCYHENGIKDIKLNLNGQENIVQLPEEDSKEMSFYFPLGEGENNIVVTVVSVDDTETVANETVTKEAEPIIQDEIEISIEKPEDVADKVSIIVRCEAGIKEIKLNMNGQDYDINLPEEALTYAPINDLELAEGVNNIKVTVVSVNGTEKTETKEITRD